MGKYRHKPIEVFISGITQDGKLTDKDFPIPVTITPTGETATDGLYGPMPIFKITWCEWGLPQLERTITVLLCDVLIASSAINDRDSLCLSTARWDNADYHYEEVK